MFAGHFAVAAMVKTKQKKVPLWALMVTTQLLDILFVIFMLSGVEGMTQVAQKSYGGSLIHASYSHSLFTAILISAILYWISKKYWGREGALTLALVNFSHWVIDLLVHRPDLPILPGNLGDFPLLGFGLWTSPVIAGAVEGLLILVGLIMYGRYTYRLGNGSLISWTTSCIMSLSLILAFVSDWYGL
jgi:hypothetical protein